MNITFINKIYIDDRASLMRSETEEFMAELEAQDIQVHYPRSFGLFEEYSHKAIADTIRIRIERFAKADLKAKRELLAEVEREVKSFRAWLEEDKNLDFTTAYYYAISLKSLLLGLPVGVQVARLFSATLDTQARK